MLNNSASDGWKERWRAENRVFRYFAALKSANEVTIKRLFSPFRYSGFSSVSRMNLSPFTKDFRGQERYNESLITFSPPSESSDHRGFYSKQSQNFQNKRITYERIRFNFRRLVFSAYWDSSRLIEPRSKVVSIRRSLIAPSFSHYLALVTKLFWSVSKLNL